LETTQAIEAADRSRAQQAMGGDGKARDIGGDEHRKEQPQTGNAGPATERSEISGIENNEGEQSDNRFRLYTENTTLLVSSLIDFSRVQSLQMNIMNIRPPSLEDAFIRLTEEKNREK
jgi:hypothetical protein